jgi:ketosteroid isomerase-like protein
MDAGSQTPVAIPDTRLGATEASRCDAPAMAARVPLVRSIVAPWERGDFSAFGWADPEIEYVLVDGPSPGRWAGLADMSAAFCEVLSAYRHYRVTAEAFRELDDERVLVLHRYSGVGKTSGLQIGEIASKGADVFHLRDGRVTRLVLYWECHRALADLGISADDDAGSPTRVGERVPAQLKI